MTYACMQGIVITGSKHDAFADDAWIVKLRRCIREQAKLGQRILGICFGAQLLAVALGGKAGSSPTHSLAVGHFGITNKLSCGRDLDNQRSHGYSGAEIFDI